MPKNGQLNFIDTFFLETNKTSLIVEVLRPNVEAELALQITIRNVAKFHCGEFGRRKIIKHADCWLAHCSQEITHRYHPLSSRVDIQIVVRYVDRT